MKQILLISLISMGLIVSAHAGFKDWGSKALSVFSQTSASDELTDEILMSAEELISGLRETLAVSAERALTDLSRKGGFSNSELYQIPLPKSVESLRKPLTLVNREDLLDDFQLTVNRAAEAGIAAAPSVLKNTIQNLSLDDLKTLWQGDDDAITAFLEKRSRDELAERILPLISQATDSTGATSLYKKLLAAIPDSKGGFFSKIQSLTKIGSKDLDLDSYVSNQALDALFAAMAAEEKAIRENPSARSTDLLKKLFKM